ncbi:MAG: helix-turn-helix transcriptional regulator [Nitrospirales bacterium]|jgi:transcriptional regulator with XRE-family HTH domain
MSSRRVFNAREFKRWRKKHQFTQVEVARRIGVAMATVSLWELGERKPSQLAAMQIEKVRRRFK